ncbi:MAG: hypothetical protein Q8S17_13495, partial [Humidesulfovibrio sp.]|nr:hypothetical protein [Humidesulfovibrio sp.]
MLSLVLSLAAPAAAQAAAAVEDYASPVEDAAEGIGGAQSAAARKAMGEILDSLTHAPQPQQRQTPTGFPGATAKPGQFPSGPSKTTPRQSGPSAP